MHMHIELKQPAAKVKAGFVKQARKLIHAAHSRFVRLTREYCHMVYFAAVFIEGHGVYSYVGGVLFSFSLLGALVGEDVE